MILIVSKQENRPHGVICIEGICIQHSSWSCWFFVDTSRDIWPLARNGVWRWSGAQRHVPFLAYHHTAIVWQETLDTRFHRDYQHSIIKHLLVGICEAEKDTGEKLTPLNSHGSATSWGLPRMFWWAGMPCGEGAAETKAMRRMINMMARRRPR